MLFGFQESFNTQPPEGGWWPENNGSVVVIDVSTHSRPKAAGFLLFFARVGNQSFNTQPPEGGWLFYA